MHTTDPVALVRSATDPVSRTHPADAWWMAAAFAAYLLLVVWRFGDFPLYFFCDEAMHGVEARSIVRSGRDVAGQFLPLFFEDSATTS